MDCFNCENCKNNEAMFYCTGKNEFIIPVETRAVERTKKTISWKKGNSQYEDRRRRIRQIEVKNTG